MDKNGSKTGGRIKGTPNHTTKQLKGMVVDFLNENWAQLQKDFKSKKMHPRDRLAFLEKLLKYAVPVMASTKGSLDIKTELEKLSDAHLDQVIERLSEIQGQQDQEET